MFCKKFDKIDLEPFFKQTKLTLNKKKLTAWSNVSLTFYENKLKIYVYKNLVNKYIIKMQSIYAGKYKKHTIEQTNFHWVGVKMSETGEYLIIFQISACF